MFTMDPPSFWDVYGEAALVILAWFTLWGALSLRAARSESRRELTAYWVAACALTCLFGAFVLVSPFFGLALAWVPLGTAFLAAVSLRRLLVLRDRGAFRW